MQTIALIVIDQLGWEDHEYLRSLTDLLGEPRSVATPFFPTVTETAHASMSVVAPPSSHGIIGGESLVEMGGGILQRVCIDNKTLYRPTGYGSGVPFIGDLSARGVECFVVAGKPKVAQLLVPLPDESCPRGITRVCLERDEMRDCLKWQIMSQHRVELPDCGIRSFRTPDNMDSSLIECATSLLDQAREPGQHSLLFLGLSQLDLMGHWHDRKSKALKGLLQELDEELTAFLSARIDEDEDCGIIVTGDHGWRRIDTAIWLSGREISCMERGGEEVRFGLPCGIRTYVDGRGEHLAALCDGGTMRIWTEDGREDEVAAWFNNTLGRYLATVLHGAALEAFLDDSNTRHPNWGNIVCLANQNVALCKDYWLDHDGQMVVPVAEHGTDSDADRAVPMWTRNIHADHALHTELGRRAVALLQA